MQATHAHYLWTLSLAFAVVEAPIQMREYRSKELFRSRAGLPLKCPAKGLALQYDEAYEKKTRI